MTQLLGPLTALSPLAWMVELVLPSVATLALLTWFRSGWPQGLDRAWWARGGWPIFVLTRVVYAAVLLVALDYGGSSDSWAWKAFTPSILEGARPGRDFLDVYSPLHFYLQALFYWLGRSSHWVFAMTPFVIGDALAVHFGRRLSRLLGDAVDSDWIGAWLVVSPLYWHQLVVRGQEEALFLGFLAVAGWLFAERRQTACSVALGLGLCATKLTFAPYAGVLLLCMLTRGRTPWVQWLIFAVIVAASYTGYVLSGAEPFPADLMSEHESKFGSGLSATDAIASLFRGFPVQIGLAIYVVGTGVATIALPGLTRDLEAPRRVVVCMAGVHAATMLTLPFCVSPYPAQGMLFALLAFALLPRTDRIRGPALVLAILLGWLCTLVWTMYRPFTVSQKPLAIATHALLLWATWRLAKGAPRRVTASPPDGVTA